MARKRKARPAISFAFDSHSRRWNRSRPHNSNCCGRLFSRRHHWRRLAAVQMNSAPLPQPAPFTCPHCGEGMDTGQQFCPRCGARVGEIARAGLSPFLIVGLGLGLLVFGGIGACGALSTISSFQSGPYQGVVLIFSLPCLLVGGIGSFLCLRPFFKRKN